MDEELFDSENLFWANEMEDEPEEDFDFDFGNEVDELNFLPPFVKKGEI